MDSTPHRNNILNENYKYVGIGVFSRADGRFFYTQVFVDNPIPPSYIISSTFPDVPLTHSHYAGIEAIYAEGITTGFSDGTYRPDQPVTRAQMGTFLARALGLID